VINHKNLPTVLGDKYVEGAEYKMVETNANPVRYGPTLPSKGWVDLGDFSDPEVDSARKFRILMKAPTPPQSAGPEDSQ
jgi:hypothetical protein